MRRFVTLFGLALLLAGCQSLPFEPQILSYDGNKVLRTFVFEGGGLSAEDAGQWTLDVEKHKVTSEATDYTLISPMTEATLMSISGPTAAPLLWLASMTRWRKRDSSSLPSKTQFLGMRRFFINEYPSEKRLTIRLSAPGVREHQCVMCNADHSSLSFFVIFVLVI